MSFSLRYRLFRVILSTLLALLLSACTDFGNGYRIWQANQRFRNGRHHDALLAYLSVMESPQAAIARYNTAHVYLAMQEDQAARELLELAAEAPDKTLAARAKHNLGVLYYRDGEYSLALALLRDSLRLEPGRPDSIKAVELVLQQLDSGSSANSDRERAGMQQGSGDDFGLFSVSAASRRNIFKSGGGDADPAIADH